MSLILYAVGIRGENQSSPKAALLFWFFGGLRCGVPSFIVILVIYKYKNRC